MTDNAIYLGRPGALAAIRPPRGNFDASRQRRTSAFELGVGGVAIDQMIGGARTYTINYSMLSRDDWTTLQAFLDGLEGPGPFALLDPGQRNMLPVNIAAATSVTNSVSGAGAPVGGFNLVGVEDTFNRAPVVSGWGTSTSGNVWTATPSGEHAATGSVGTQTHNLVNTFHTAVIDVGAPDFNLTCDIAFDEGLALGASITQWLCGRYTDASNYYAARLEMTAGGSVVLTILKRVTGSLSNATGMVAATVSTAGHTSGDVWRINFTGSGQALAASAWLRDSGTQPTTAQVTATDASLTTGNSAAVLSRLETGNTNVLPTTFTTSYFLAAPTYATIASSTAYTDAGPRVLACTFTGAPSSSLVIGIDWPSSTFAYGVPVVAGRAVCFSCWLRGGGSDPISTWAVRLVWKDASGAVVSTTTTGSGALASSSGAWVQPYAQGVPPAGAVYVDAQISYSSGATAGAVAYFRRFMLNEGTTPDATWMAGTGVWPVAVVSGVDSWPFQAPDYRTGPVVVFAEDVS